MQRVRSAAPGHQNKTLFVAACRLGELIGADALDPATAHLMLKQSAARLATANCDCTDREIDATIASGLRIGARNPRTSLPTPPRRPTLTPSEPTPVTSRYF